MPLPATSLHTRLEEADSLLRIGRVGAARMAFVALLEAAQDRGDRHTEVTARAMLAQCAIHAHDLDAARDQLDEARARVEPGDVAAEGRVRSVEIRLRIAEGEPATAARAIDRYIDWATDHRAWAQVVDGCGLAAERSEGDDRATWRRRAVQAALDHGPREALGRLYNDLAASRDALGRADEAFEAYTHALAWHRRSGTTRQIAAGCWAVGAVAVRLEDWGAAEAHLAEAIHISAGGEDLLDVHALALVDLARIHAASGDVVEARRVVLRAMALAREIGLPQAWPERWAPAAAFARELELESR